MDWHKLQIIMLGSSVHTVQGCSGRFRDVQESGCMITWNEWNESIRTDKRYVWYQLWGVTIGRRQDKTCNDKQPERFLLAKNN